MRKSALLALVAGFCFTLALTAEGNQDQSPITIEIAYPVAVDAPITELLNGYIAEFEAENRDITVKAIYSGGYGDVKTAIQTSFEGGGDVPAMAVMLATDLYDLANAGYVDSMDELAKDSSYLKDFIPAFMNNSYYADSLYSIPFQRSAVVVYYNADLFKERELPLPTTWNEWAQTAWALTEENSRWGLEYPSGWPYWLFQPLAIGNGQNIVTDDTTVNFNAPEVVEAVQFYIDLSHKYGAMPQGVQGSWGNVTGNLASGNTAMIVHSSGSLTKLLDSVDFELGVMAVPGKQGTPASVPGGGNIYITAGLDEAEKKASLEFIKFITSPEREGEFSRATGYIVPRRSARETEDMAAYFEATPQALEILDVIEYAGTELSTQNLGEVRSIFHKYLQAAYNGEMTAQAAMDTAQAEADKALADFR
ncbi:MAG: ABC transporter substrate-binding protein [Spirochaetales bacterium]|nr:ABC transporter substrate-binding protein [Spirochaetales bacterium]